MLQAPPRTTRTLILLNIVVYGVQSLSGAGLIAHLALWPAAAAPFFSGYPSFAPWQLLTYSLLHGSLTHLLFNMFALYMFGGDLEYRLGRRRFLLLYLAGVVSAGLVQLAVVSTLGGEPYPTVGASGGIFGLLLAYARYFPHDMVMLIIPPIPMPARIFVVLCGALELFLGVTGTQEGVAHFAHLGGMLGAWLLIRS